MNVDAPTDVMTKSDAEELPINVVQERLAGGAVILVDKPEGWTSFDVVNKIRRTFGIRKVGHAGTLDPMATGLLIVCTAGRTKDVDVFVGLEKTYLGTLKLGETTPSFDADTEVTERRPTDRVTIADIEAAAAKCTGTLEQMPPMYSAVKQNGKRLYKLARKGVTVERKSRTVTVFELAVTDISMPFVSFRIRCSKGTYVRAIADEIGRTLGTGAHLTGLRRTAIGRYTVDTALTIDDVKRIADNGVIA
jgi:tRNA pseudouridine55 synthase